MILPPFFEDGDYPQPEEIQLLESITYEWCPRVEMGWSENCQCMLCEVLRTARVTPVRIRYDGFVHDNTDVEHARRCALCSYFELAFHLFHERPCYCDDCEEAYNNVYRFLDDDDVAIVTTEVEVVFSDTNNEVAPNPAVTATSNRQDIRGVVADSNQL